MLSVSMFCSPFLFLYFLDAGDVLGKAYVGTTFPLTTSLLCDLDPICPLILVIGLLGCFSTRLLFASPEWLDEKYLCGVSSVGGCVHESFSLFLSFPFS